MVVSMVFDLAIAKEVWKVLVLEFVRAEAMVIEKGVELVVLVVWKEYCLAQR